MRARKNDIAAANLVIVASFLVSALVLAVYANHLHNSFHFDDAHTIENNAAIRSLGNIPRFFCDATTFSSLPSNQSYRPLLSTLFAIDYRLGGGLHPFVFHLSIFIFFVALLGLLARLVYRLLEATADSPRNVWIALGAAMLYGLHPANADTVNYISASSDVVSTLGIVASFVLYLEFPGLRRYYLYIIPAAVALLAKPVAAVFPLLFAAYCLLFDRGSVEEKTGWWRRFREIVMPFLVCGLVLLLVQGMTPRTWVAGARNTRHYLITQPYVAWRYFRTFFWPNDLSADYDLNPFATTDDPRFWAGLLFLALIVAASMIALRRRGTRLIGFGLLWFLIALLPTSLFPLAEVMNDHRTFLPYIGLAMALAGTLSFLFTTRAVRDGKIGKIGLTVAASLLLCLAGYATFQRNKIWQSEEMLWRDVTLKSPNNPRGLMNYGTTLMARGDYQGALDYFHRALVIAPQYSSLLVNLAIAEGGTRQYQIAEKHFAEALQLAPSSPDSYTFYARYLIDHDRAAEGQALLGKALALSPADVTAQELWHQTTSVQTKATPESYLALSLRRYQEGHYDEALAAAQSALALRRDYAEAWNNICAANNKLGRYETAQEACAEALRLKPDFELARNNLQYAREMMAQRPESVPR